MNFFIRVGVELLLIVMKNLNKHPLAGKKIVTFDDLEPYPCLSFEQGIYNSFYFAEEIHSTISHRVTFMSVIERLYLT